MLEENRHEQRTTRWLQSHPDIPLPRRDVRCSGSNSPLRRPSHWPTYKDSLTRRAHVLTSVIGPLGCTRRRGVGASLKRTRIHHLPGGSKGPHALRPSRFKLPKRAALTQRTSVASCPARSSPQAPGSPSRSRRHPPRCRHPQGRHAWVELRSVTMPPHASNRPCHQ